MFSNLLKDAFDWPSKANKQKQRRVMMTLCSCSLMHSEAAKHDTNIQTSITHDVNKQTNK